MFKPCFIRGPKLFLLLLTAAVLPPNAFAQKDLTNIPDPDPELERQSFQVADGFEVNLFAADPMLAKPIQMNWDAAGRLWVACSELYPQILPGQTANDKILVLEDTDGDGRADRTTVFADGLLIPTGVEPDSAGPNGLSAFVANSTELLHLSDRDGDGRADTSRIVLSGFGTEDTHHIIHTFRWGYDGCLYFNQSIYIHSHVETPWGVRRLGGGGIWQFRPDSARLEVFCRGFVNSWGHHFDDWGQSFATDGAYGEGINYVFPGAIFFSAPGAARVVKGLNPGSPKHCGLEIVSSRHLPDDWRGNMLTNDFRGNRVCRFVISENGSGYAAREMPELIKTSHVAFRPIDIKMGPDGAIYVADWYNPIIQHGEVDFRDPRRDHTHGRIWRVIAKDRPLVPRPPLVGASVEALLEHLRSPEPWTRHFAKRLVKERGAAEVLPTLKGWLSRLDPADTDIEHHKLEALWTLQSLDEVNWSLLKELRDAKDYRVRAAAIRVLAAWHERLEKPIALNWLSHHVQDDHPRVRLEAVRALSLIRHSDAAEWAMVALDRPMDQFLDFALWQTMRDLEPYWLPGVRRADRSDQMGFSGDPRRLVFALRAVGSSLVVRPLVILLREGNVPGAEYEAVLTLIGSEGGPEELALVFDLAMADGATPARRRAALLRSLITATQRRKLRPSGDLTRLGSLLNPEADDPSLAELAVRAAGLWQVESLRPQLVELVRFDGTSDPVRQAAMDGLARLGGPESQEILHDYCGADHPLAVRRMAVTALVSMDVDAGAQSAVAVLAECDNEADATAILSAFLERKNGPNALVAAMADRALPSEVAKVGVRLAQISGREQPELIAALKTAGDLAQEPRRLTLEEVQQLAQDVVDRGDPSRGEDTFRRRELNCFKCHTVSGAGGQVGPDLASIGASAQIDYLIDSLLEPNKQVKEGFHSIVVATDDGRVLSGIKVRQTEAELVMRNAENQEVAIPLGTIEEHKAGGSIMPAGLTDHLTRGEFVDLLRFLSLLGKVDGPYAIGPSRVARRWEVLDATPEGIEHVRSAGPNAVPRGDPRLHWKPAYSKVSGELPLAEVPPIKIGYQTAVFGFARCQLDVSTAGKVRLVLNAADGTKVWLGQSAVEAQSAMSFELPAGKHTLTFAVQLDTRREGLRVELQDEPGSPAQVQFVLGN